MYRATTTKSTINTIAVKNPVMKPFKNCNFLAFMISSRESGELFHYP